MNEYKRKREWIKKAINEIDEGTPYLMSNAEFMSLLRFFEKNGLVTLSWQININPEGTVYVSKANAQPLREKTA